MYLSFGSTLPHTQIYGTSLCYVTHKIEGACLRFFTQQAVNCRHTLLGIKCIKFILQNLSHEASTDRFFILYSEYAVLIILDKNADCILNIIYYPSSG